MNKYYKEDIKDIIETAISLGLNDKTFLVTGATGMIGKTIIDALKQITDENNLYLVGRNIEKVNEMCFQSKMHALDYLSLSEIQKSIDFVIHLAAPTTSSFLANSPIETIDSIYCTTKQLLDFASTHQSKFIYISSMEVYGEVYDEEPKQEEDLGYLSLTNARNSYPEAKRLCELLCYSYAKEYGLNTNIARLAQTFGAGTSIEDSRVFGYIARCVRDNKEIVLKTKGDSIGNYCYLSDAIKGILFILAKGLNGETYNVVGDNNRSSIYDMASMISKEMLNKETNVILDIDPNASFPKSTKLNMDNSKLKSLGWNPRYTLLDMYKRMMGY